MSAQWIANAEERIRKSRQPFNSIRQQGFVPTPMIHKEKTRGVRGRFYLECLPFVNKPKSDTSGLHIVRFTLRMPNNLAELTIYNDVSVLEDGSLSFDLHSSDKIKTNDMVMLRTFNDYNVKQVISPFGLFEVTAFAYTSAELEMIKKLAPGPIDMTFWATKSLYTNKDKQEVIISGFNGNIKTIIQNTRFSKWSSYKFLSKIATCPVNKPIRMIGASECQEAAGEKFFECADTQSYIINRRGKFLTLNEDETVQYLKDKPVGFVTVENNSLVTDEKDGLIRTYNKVEYIEIRMSMLLSCCQDDHSYVPIEGTVQLKSIDLSEKVDFSCVFFNETSVSPVSVSDRMLREFEAFLLGQFKYIDWVLICRDSAKEAGRLPPPIDDKSSDIVAFSTAFEKPLLHLNFPSFIKKNGLRINQAAADKVIALNSSKKEQYIVVLQPSAEEKTKINYAFEKDADAAMVNYGYMTEDMRKQFLVNNPDATFYMLPFINKVGHLLRQFWEECEHKDIEKFVNTYLASWPLDTFDCKDCHVFIYCINEEKLMLEKSKMKRFVDYFSGNKKERDEEGGEESEGDSPYSKRARLEEAEEEELI